MRAPFKLKSGNASSFKNLGSSPVKGTGDNLKRIATEKKELAKKTGTWYREGAGPKPNTPNVKGFNTTGSSASTTPGYSTTKAAKAKKFKKDFDARQVSKQKGKDFVKNLKIKPTKIAKNFGKKVLKGAGRLAGGLGLAAMAYDAYKSGQEHSGGRVGYEKNPNYDPSKGGDKHGNADANAQFIRKDGGEHTSFWGSGKQKTGIVTPDPSKSIYKKK